MCYLFVNISGMCAPLYPASARVSEHNIFSISLLLGLTISQTTKELKLTNDLFKTLQAMIDH